MGNPGFRSKFCFFHPKRGLTLYCPFSRCCAQTPFLLRLSLDLHRRSSLKPPMCTSSIISKHQEQVCIFMSLSLRVCCLSVYIHALVLTHVLCAMRLCALVCFSICINAPAQHVHDYYICTEMQGEPTLYLEDFQPPYGSDIYQAADPQYYDDPYQVEASSHSLTRNESTRF